MDSRITVYITLVVISGVLSTFLSLYTLYKRKEIPGSQYLIALTALQSLYIFAFSFELASDTLEEIKRWIVVEYVGIAFAPVFGLLLILRYIGRELPRLASGLLFVIPAITLLMVATNDSHHLFYKLLYLRENAPSPMADVIIGQWYIVHGAYTFGCMTAGALLLARQWRKTNKAYRPQLATMIGGSLIPTFATFLYLLGVTPDGMDTVPIVLSLTSGLYIWAMMSTNMLRISPIAKQSLFDSMAEGVLVLDLQEHLIDFNDAARRLLPQLKAVKIGGKLDEIWMSMSGSHFPLDRKDGVIKGLIKWERRQSLSVYEIRSSVINGRKGEPLGSLLMLIDVTEQHRLQEQLKRQAYYDGLTDIYNRTQFIRSARSMLAAAAEQKEGIVLILFDIDHFKRFNDTYGHESGDAILVHAAAVCRSLLPDEALFGRYGGEEFVIAWRGRRLQEGERLAETLRAALPSRPLSTTHGNLTVTASFGVTATDAAQGEGQLEALLREADSALYAAKHRGRNTVSSANVHASQ